MRLCKSVEELALAFSEFNFKVFSLDTETSGLNSEDALRYDKLKLDVITLYDGKESIYIECNPGTIEYTKTYFKSFLNNSNLVICHNIVFDMKVLHKYNISLRDCEWFDTIVAYHLIDENDYNIGLKDLSTKFLNVNLTKYEDIQGKKDSSNIQFVDYAINDAIYTYELAMLFKSKLIEEDLINLFRGIEMPFMRPLLDMEINGILINDKKLLKISEKLDTQRKDLEIEILNTIGIKYGFQYNLLNNKTDLVCDISLDSNEDLADILFNKLGLEVIDKSEKTGKPSVGKFTLENLKGKHPVIELLLKYKQIQKMLSSFSYNSIYKFIDSDNCIRSNYKDTGTVTGRLSCNNMNLQQLPKEKKDIGANIREVFISGPGRKLIAADYSGQELRVAAQISQDEGLISAFNSGRDFHTETSKKFNVSRAQAKIINFGILYGKGSFGFAKDFNTTEEEAQKIVDDYFNAFPKVKESIEITNKELDKQDYVTNMFGRRRRMPKISKNGWTGHLRKDYRQAYNFKIQGASADMIRIAAYKCYLLGVNNPEWDLKTLATIHDECLYSVKEEYVSIASECIKECFETALSFSIPIISEVKSGDNYAECK